VVVVNTPRSAVRIRLRSAADCTTVALPDNHPVIVVLRQAVRLKQVAARGILLVVTTAFV
jgi:hypothetical protein